MTSKSLIDILVEHGACERNGNTIVVPEGEKITFFAAVGTAPMTLAQVREVTLADDYVVVATRKERVFVAFEDLRMVQISTNERKTGYK